MKQFSKVNIGIYVIAGLVVSAFAVSSDAGYILLETSQTLKNSEPAIIDEVQPDSTIQISELIFLP